MDSPSLSRQTLGGGVLRERHCHYLYQPHSTLCPGHSQQAKPKAKSTSRKVEQIVRYLQQS